MSDILSNGHLDPDSNPVPRIVPPQGQRTARGQLSDADDALETSAIAGSALENGVPESAVPESAAPLSAVEKSVDSPAVEDIYEPALANPDEEAALYDYDDVPNTDASAINSGFFGPGGKRPDTPKDVELGLMDHLNELRVRLLWCAAILGIGMCVTWNYSLTLQEWFSTPIKKIIAGSGKIQIIDPTESFTIALQFSLASALILTAPLLFWQVWRFIEPALTNSERRYSLVLVPFSSVLFFMGAGLGFAVSPLFFKFFLQFLPKGVEANWQYGNSIVLMAKMLLVFGVMFQVPIIVIFLNKLGIVSRNLLIEYWRHAVVLIFIVVAILTPTWDPLTMTVCAVPPCLLYVLSIWLIKWL
ncbi:MAG TPA: twin-arginine translocase subunit TatC [Abditibacterium sp.]|jgi:sec-independent protein translocase protein TatC